MTAEQRYVVKLASGRWLNDDRIEVDSLRLAFKASRPEAYRIAAMYGAVALRLRPSARAAELAKIRAEVAELRGRCTGYRDAADEGRAELAKLRAEVEALKVDLADASEVRDRKWAEAKHATSQLHAMTAERDHERRTANEAVAQLHDVTRERDALAAQLAALPPDISDEALAREVKVASSLDGPWSVHAARIARHLLRGPVAPARPVDELREELRGTFYETIGNTHDCWVAVAKRARELGAR